MPEVAIITFVPAEGLSQELADYLSHNDPDWENESQIGPFLGTETLDPLTEACQWGEDRMSQMAKDGEWEASIVSIPDYLFDSSNLKDWSEPPANDPTDPRGN
jgi:hypothetical protein